MILLITLKVRDLLPEKFTEPEEAVAPVAVNPLPTSETAPLTSELPPSSEQLIKTESEALKRFFGKDIAIPKPPQELFQTLEGMSKFGIIGFEPHFLPQVSLTEESKIPGWKIRPESWFWQSIKDGKISRDAAKLQKGWYLVDGRRKPNYDNGQQRYDNDYAEPVIQDLRNTGIIQKYHSVPDSSRFGASPDEIEKIILPQVVRITSAKGDLTNKRYIEFNIWGNMFHPEWGQTNTSEWFADEFGDDNRLFGGRSDCGGLARVHPHWSGLRYGDIAFSPVVRFPSKP